MYIKIARIALLIHPRLSILIPGRIVNTLNTKQSLISPKTKMQHNDFNTLIPVVRSNPGFTVFPRRGHTDFLIGAGPGFPLTMCLMVVPTLIWIQVLVELCQS